jgi:hypothetical protein
MTSKHEVAYAHCLGLHGTGWCRMYVSWKVALLIRRLAFAIQKAMKNIITGCILYALREGEVMGQSRLTRVMGTK